MFKVGDIVQRSTPYWNPSDPFMKQGGLYKITEIDVFLSHYQKQQFRFEGSLALWGQSSDDLRFKLVARPFKVGERVLDCPTPVSTPSRRYGSNLPYIIANINPMGHIKLESILGAWPPNRFIHADLFDEFGLKVFGEIPVNLSMTPQPVVKKKPRMEINKRG
jgi:hypothetical protein